MSERLLQLCQLIQHHREDDAAATCADISFNVSNSLEQSIKAYASIGMQCVVNEEDNTTTISHSYILEMSKVSLRTVFVKYHIVLQKIIHLKTHMSVAPSRS